MFWQLVKIFWKTDITKISYGVEYIDPHTLGYKPMKTVEYLKYKDLYINHYYNKRYSNEKINNVYSIKYMKSEYFYRVFGSFIWGFFFSWYCLKDLIDDIKIQNENNKKSKLNIISYIKNLRK